MIYMIPDTGRYIQCIPLGRRNRLPTILRPRATNPVGVPSPRTGEKESPADNSSPADDESHECSVSQREEKESPAGDSSLAGDKSRRRRMAQVTSRKGLTAQ
ncbi:hypothetical protein B296_00003173 [Ensete ventricosum]|uniref:Uncharacterized protein n=1 Tax=Ensete ventricosum TaxID=4639 RepID=A0A427ANB7_ENSVE|nr:hypothetical protein B296_00003173 [Ensete ventricosum]